MKKIIFIIIVLLSLLGCHNTKEIDKIQRDCEKHDTTNTLSSPDTMECYQYPPNIIEIKQVGNNVLKIEYEIKPINVLIKYRTGFKKDKGQDFEYFSDSIPVYYYKDFVMTAETTIFPIITKIVKSDGDKYYSGDVVYKEKEKK